MQVVGREDLDSYLGKKQFDFSDFSEFCVDGRTRVEEWLERMEVVEMVWEAPILQEPSPTLSITP